MLDLERELHTRRGATDGCELWSAIDLRTLTEVDGALIYTVEGRAEPVEFFTIYYAVRTPREELERHDLDVDIDALLASLGE